MKRPELKEHGLLILSGPPASGKTRLARELAAEKGRFVTVSTEQLGFINEMSEVLEAEPDVVIVEGPLPQNPRGKVFLKNVLATDIVTIPLRGGEAKEVRAPLYWVLCTDEAIPCAQELDRRGLIHIMRPDTPDKGEIE